MKYFSLFVVDNSKSVLRKILVPHTFNMSVKMQIIYLYLVIKVISYNYIRMVFCVSFIHNTCLCDVLQKGETQLIRSSLLLLPK